MCIGRFAVCSYLFTVYWEIVYVCTYICTYVTCWKTPEGQEYAPWLKPTAPIRLADRITRTIHHAIAPSSKKDGSMTDFQHTWFDPHGSHRKILPCTLEAPNPWPQLPIGVMDSARDFDLLGESVPWVRVSARTLAFLRIFDLFSLPSFYLCTYIYIFFTNFFVEANFFKATGRTTKFAMTALELN